MKRIAMALMFVAVSAVAQERPDAFKPPQATQQESFICIPESVVRQAVQLILDQAKRIADLEQQLGERK